MLVIIIVVGVPPNNVPVPPVALKVLPTRIPVVDVIPVMVAVQGVPDVPLPAIVPTVPPPNDGVTVMLKFA
jgi:hypothetical protein